MKEITNIFEIKPGIIYLIDNTKEIANDPHTVKYKVITKCVSVSDGKKHSINPNATFTDIIVVIGGKSELLVNWTLDQTDLSSICGVFEFQPDLYPEYYI